MAEAGGCSVTRSGVKVAEYCCAGDDWDNENRFEGWGAGEWSDLKATDKVLQRTKEHIKILVECGVKGFRFDAAKHMRPETIRIYVDYIRSVCPDAYIYLEVLAGDPVQHKPFEGWADTTDFGYCFALREAIMGSEPSRLLASRPSHAAVSRVQGVGWDVSNFSSALQHRGH